MAARTKTYVCVADGLTITMPKDGDKPQEVVRVLLHDQVVAANSAEQSIIQSHIDGGFLVPEPAFSGQRLTARHVYLNRLDGDEPPSLGKGLPERPAN
jgi:hypothetical protein